MYIIYSPPGFMQHPELPHLRSDRMRKHHLSRAPNRYRRHRDVLLWKDLTQGGIMMSWQFNRIIIMALVFGGTGWCVYRTIKAVEKK